MNRAAWRDPTVQGELAAWTSRLNAVGIGITRTELEQRVWDLAVGYVDVRTAVLTPFQPYYRYCGTWQSWKMFIAPHRYPSRLHIDVYERGAWAPLYVARSAEHDWHRRQLDHDRMRASIFRYAWRHYRRHYAKFGRWVAIHVARERPDAEQVRLRFYKYRTATPVEVRSHTEPEGEWTNELLLDLAHYRCPEGECPGAPKAGR